MKNYKPVLGKTRTGLAAPVKGLKCSHTLMKEMKLKESNPFFHCKANYEATKRSSVYGAGVANIIDAGKEMKDIFKYLKEKNGVKVDSEELLSVLNKIREIEKILRKN